MYSDLFRYLLPIIIVMGLGGSAYASKAIVNNDYMLQYKKAAKFEDVRESVELAITERGYVINNVSYIGKMLTRTGKDLGENKVIYRHAQNLEFCSATISRRTMEADPNNIIFCPYIIAIHELEKEPGQIYLTYRRPQLVGNKESKATLKAVDTLLHNIVKDALEW